MIYTDLTKYFWTKLSDADFVDFIKNIDCAYEEYDTLKGNYHI